MLKFYLDKQENYDPKREQKFLYEPIKEINSFDTLSNNMAIVDFYNKIVYYTFIHDTNNKFTIYKNHKFEEYVEDFIDTISVELDKNKGYCEVSKEQMIEFSKNLLKKNWMKKPLFKQLLEISK